MNAAVLTNIMFLLLYCSGFAVLLLIACAIEWLYLKWWGRKPIKYRPSMRDWKSHHNA